MSEREDIIDGSQAITAKSGLVYTCNLGWLDLGHMDPKSTRAHTGASALWEEINAGGPDARQMLMGSRGPVTRDRTISNAVAAIKFPDGATGFKLTYNQDMGRRVLGKIIFTGVTRNYIVRHNLTLEEKKSVALAIFMEVTMQFENYQDYFPKFITNSGFSQEDLVSNLIGFHIATGNVSKAQVLSMAKPVAKSTALAIWDRNGSVGSNKNRGFKPMLSPDTTAITDAACINECGGVIPRIPDFLESVIPAKKGHLFMNGPMVSA